MLKQIQDFQAKTQQAAINESEGLNDSEVKDHILGNSRLINNIKDNQEGVINFMKQSGTDMNPNQINSAKNALISNANVLNDSINEVQNSGSQAVNNLRAATNSLANQQVVTDILQTEVDNAERSYRGLKQDNNDKLRMIQINTYYTEKYRAHTDLMKKIIFFILPILLLTILGTKGILPKDLSYTLAGIILIIGIVVVVYNIYDLNNRNNFDFDEYMIDSNSSLEDSSGNTHDISQTETILDKVHDHVFNEDCPACPKPSDSKSSLFSTVGGDCATNYNEAKQTIWKGNKPITCPKNAPKCENYVAGSHWGKCQK